MTSISLATLATGLCTIGGTSAFIPVLPVQQNVQSHRDLASNTEYHSHSRALHPAFSLTRPISATPFSSRLFHQSGGEYNDFGGFDDEDEDDDEIDLNEADWRTFRAKLVMNFDSSSVSTAQETSAPSKTASAPKATPNHDVISAKSSSVFGSANSPDSASSEEELTTHRGEIVTEDEDVDGIGQLFFDEEAAQEHFNIIQNGDHWAYDSGNVVETGAVILGGVEQDFGFGLRQQYFHKAAILVLDHDEGKFTKGIILNRPSDRVLTDPENPSVQWRVWFGGDVQGLDSVMPDFVCLHSLKDKKAAEVSTQVMKDIKYCSFEDAKDLVKEGKACAEDFWVFCGYAGWAPGQLMGELERKSWYMVATDSQTLLEEMARQSADADPRDAGLDTWELLMQMIGQEETAKDTVGEFDDLMIKEWARRHLLQENVAAARNHQSLKDGNPNSSNGKELMGISAVDKLIRKATGFARGEEVRVGSIVRASSAVRSQFLLDKQEFHKSLVLVISDDDNISVGVILNRPSSKGLDVQIVDKTSGKKKIVSVPLRYGGEYAVKGQAPLLWLHCSERLRSANIGDALGSSDGIWSCTPEQATTAMSHGLASPTDFMVVSGVSVWTKGEKGLARGIQGEVSLGNFEPVSAKVAPKVFGKLLTQDLLTGVNLFRLLAIGNAAWKVAGDRNGNASESEDAEKQVYQPMGGLGEDYDEDDDSLVFRSNVKVEQLADDALKTWVSTFLLGVPSLR